MYLDWEGYKRQRIEVSRQEELIVLRLVMGFLTRYLWAKLRRKPLFKYRWDTSDMDFFEVCERKDVLLRESVTCKHCFKVREYGSKMSELYPLMRVEKDCKKYVTCRECADAGTEAWNGFVTESRLIREKNSYLKGWGKT